MAQKIKYLVMDVDGTLTDGKIYMGNNGELFKAFHIKDGCGIHDILIPANIIPVIITGRQSCILEKRCLELGITKLYQSVTDKIKTVDEIIKDTSYHYQNIAYIGDDINDLCAITPIKKAGGLIGCPADAAESIKTIADFVSRKNGGDGAVREFIEWIVDRNASFCHQSHPESQI